MQVTTLDEFNILQMLHSEVMKLRAAHKLIDKIILTEEDYKQVRETLELPEGKDIAVIPPSNTYFEIKREDGTFYNPVTEQQNRKVQIAGAADEIFKQ